MVGESHWFSSSGWRSMLKFTECTRRMSFLKSATQMDVFLFPFSHSKTGWLLECHIVKGSKLPLVIHTIVGFYIAIIRIPFIKVGRPLHMSSPSLPCEGDVPAESFGLCNQSMQRSKRGTKSRHWYVAREVVFCQRYAMIIRLIYQCNMYRRLSPSEWFQFNIRIYLCILSGLRFAEIFENN